MNQFANRILNYFSTSKRPTISYQILGRLHPYLCTYIMVRVFDWEMKK